MENRLVAMSHDMELDGNRKIAWKPEGEVCPDQSALSYEEVPKGVETEKLLHDG